MKRLLAVLLLLPLFIVAAGQNNPYQINDECYEYFKEAELLVGKEGFEKANADLLHSAIAHGDTKAQTLYYVEHLKNITRMAVNKRDFSHAMDERVLKAQEQLKNISDKLGYHQYFYYSYELVQNYFYNSGRQNLTMEYVQELQRVALERKEPYGEWVSYRYMVTLYIEQNDYVSAKQYIKKAISIQEKSTDPTLSRQSVSRLYCDLADTYPVGTDSSRLNVAKAVQHAKVHMDTVRCHYYLARSTALAKDYDEYYRHRDYCLNDKGLWLVSRTAAQLFAIIDSMIEGDMSKSMASVMKLSKIREIKFVANIAEVYGFKDEAFTIEKYLVARNESRLAEVNRSKLAELNARLGNDALSAELVSAQHREEVISRIVTILSLVLLIGIVFFLFLYTRILQRNNRQLKAANEQVMLANEAKTRFVQNMSHEVRTPLNAIVGFSQLLGLPDGSFPEEEKAEFANHIVNNAQMLTMLLDDILSTTAMDSGSYKINIEDGECCFMCQAAMSSAEHRLQPGVQMRFEPQFEGQHTFRTDPRRVQQILINLLTNACKHTTAGEIVLRCSLTENPGMVTFSVTDTGTGVPAEQAEAIFDRFKKLNEFVQGTGLGLSICREITEKMGGKIFLDTKYEGKGARFVLELPENPEMNNL